jgi:peroxiredoxin
LRERYREIEGAGLDVLVVLCQKRDNVLGWLAADPVPFPVLVDDDRSRAKAWGAYVRVSYDSLNIARPASFVVEPTGVLRYARISSNQLDAAPIEEILAARPWSGHGAIGS